MARSRSDREPVTASATTRDRRRPRIAPGVERLLLADSGGYCANPLCPSPYLFRLDEQHRVDEDHVPSVAQMAHLIAVSPAGPRGLPPLAPGETDRYENLVLLCANCHTLVDDMRAIGKYSVEWLRQWKSEHRRRVRDEFEAPPVADRAELNAEIGKLLRRNYAIWATYGPNSAIAREDPASDVAEVWRREAREEILPNNRRVLALLDRNASLLSGDELAVVEEFRVHARAFARTQLGRPVPGAPEFPQAMAELFADADG